MNILRYVYWRNDSSRGIVGVKVEQNIFHLRQLRGSALPVEMLLRVMNAALGDDWAAEFERNYRDIKYPVAVEVRRGGSGCRDYLLRRLVDEEFSYAPVCTRGSIHVSMYGRLNTGVCVWTIYLPPLLGKIFTDFPQQLEGGSVDAYEPRRFDFVNPSDDPSGLLEAIEACAVINVLGGEGSA